MKGRCYLDYICQGLAYISKKDAVNSVDISSITGRKPAVAWPLVLARRTPIETVAYFKHKTLILKEIHESEVS